MLLTRCHQTICACFLGLYGTLTALPASARPITELVPAGSLVVYIAQPYCGPDAISTTRPTTGPAPGSGASAIAQILAFLSASGLVAEEGQVFADTAAALPLMGQFEHAIVLLDVRSKAVPHPTSRPGEPDDHDPDRVSVRLDQLQGAVIFRTAGQHRLVLEQLNRIIGRYTNAEVAKLQEQVVEGYKYQRLADDRLPVWAVWEWGRLDDFFVVSFGTGAFPTIAKSYLGKAPRLADDQWFRSATEKTAGDRAFAQSYIALGELEKRIGEAATQRYTRVMDILGGAQVTHDLWTVGMEGRALAWYRCFRRGGEDQVRRYSDPKVFPPEHRRIIPDQANYYAVINVPTRWLVDNLPRAWVAAGSAGQAETWARVWRRLEDETGVDIDGSLVDHLGQNIVIFDYPPHPLRIPFAVTIAFEIDNREAVQVAINAILGAWSRYLDDRAKRSDNALVRVKVIHDRDGVWYLQAGILGPALKVTDRYVVLSWSPQALREALRFIERPPPEE